MSAERLREIERVRQQPGHPHRRWFTCPSCDLFVWTDDDGVCRFEFCYDKSKDEHSFTWDRASGIQHNEIDDGEANPLRNDTPIAVPDGTFEGDVLADRFEAVAGEVDTDIARFVAHTLRHGIDEH